MTKLLFKLAQKLGLVSKILPALLTAWAEGKLGKKPQAVYIWLEGKKTILGMVLIAAGTAAEALAANYPELAWAPEVATVAFWIGSVLAGVGLVDGGLRSPWPKGTRIPEKAKKG